MRRFSLPLRCYSLLRFAGEAGEGAVRGARGRLLRSQPIPASPCDLGRDRASLFRRGIPRRMSYVCVCVCIVRLRARVLTCSNKTRVSASMDRLARSIDRALAGRSIQTTAVPVAGALRSPSSVFSSSSSSCRRGCFSSPSSTFSAVVARARFASFLLSRVRETAETLFISTGSARARAHGSRAPQSVTSAASVRLPRASRRQLSKDDEDCRRRRRCIWSECV